MDRFSSTDRQFRRGGILRKKFHLVSNFVLSGENEKISTKIQSILHRWQYSRTRWFPIFSPLARGTSMRRRSITILENFTNPPPPPFFPILMQKSSQRASLLFDGEIEEIQRANSSRIEENRKRRRRRKKKLNEINA